MSDTSNRDKTLTPYEQVARMYSLRNPHDPISADRAQAIGVGAMMKLKAKIRSEEICKRILQQRRAST
jgi:hypothetical protein